LNNTNFCGLKSEKTHLVAAILNFSAMLKDIRNLVPGLSSTYDTLQMYKNWCF